MERAAKILWEHAKSQYGHLVPGKNHSIWLALANTQSKPDVEATQKEMQATSILKDYVPLDADHVTFLNAAIDSSTPIENHSQFGGLAQRYVVDGQLYVKVLATWKQVYEPPDSLSPSNRTAINNGAHLSAPGAPERPTNHAYDTSGSAPRRNLQSTFEQSDPPFRADYLFVAMLFSALNVNALWEAVNFFLQKDDITSVVKKERKKDMCRVFQNRINEPDPDVLFKLLDKLPPKTILALSTKYMKEAFDASGKTTQDVIQAMLTDIRIDKDKYKADYDRYCKDVLDI